MRERIVLLGGITKMPVGGVVWQTLHYLLGLERLGYEAYYVEAHARTPSMLMTSEDDDSSALAASFLSATLSRFDLGDRWAFHALHDDGRVLGMSASELQRLYRDAAAIINLHGGTAPRLEHVASRRLVYLETDPVQLQVELNDGVKESIEFLDAHMATFTFAENYRGRGCGLPVSDRYAFLPTRQPVVLDLWPHSHPTSPCFTTVGNWKQLWRPVTVDGATLTWSKHVEFEKVLDLPGRSPYPLELALSSIEPDAEERLRQLGWRVRAALPMSADMDLYRAYISASQGEFTVAKEQNVRLRTGWFSDRSATYLAAGRPVVTQDTGFGDVLPTGEGLFAFATGDEAADALEAVASAPRRHRAAARAVARACFAHDVVLPPLLEAIGLTQHRRLRHRRPQHGLPAELDIMPVSKRPTVLAPDTSAYLQLRSVESLAEVPNPAAEPVASIIVPTYDNVLFLRLALESVLLARCDTSYEIVVVDNGCADGTAAYLDALAHANPGVRVERMAANAGFAGGVNAGVRAARGDVIVLLNDDTIVADGWLDGLCRVLDDRTVGMVGPRTTQVDAPHRDPASYRTIGEFRALAAARAVCPDAYEVARLTMFCVALRRSVWDAVGPLDESFEIGMFEDDDYCIRMRAAGLRLACAAGVLIHHFGEVSLGKLAPGGEYSRVFDANRARFEAKWHTAWTRVDETRDPLYDRLVDDVCQTMLRAIPAGARAAIVSRGDDRLLNVGGIVARHFPADADGGYAGHYPSDDGDAVAQVGALASEGVTHLVIPRTSAWWLEFYAGLRAHLDEVAGLVVADSNVTIFELKGAGLEHERS